MPKKNIIELYIERTKGIEERAGDLYRSVLGCIPEGYRRDADAIITVQGPDEIYQTIQNSIPEGLRNQCRDLIHQAVSQFRVNKTVSTLITPDWEEKLIESGNETKNNLREIIPFLDNIAEYKE